MSEKKFTPLPQVWDDVDAAMGLEAIDDLYPYWIVPRPDESSGIYRGEIRLVGIGKDGTIIGVDISPQHAWRTRPISEAEVIDVLNEEDTSSCP